VIQRLGSCARVMMAAETVSETLNRNSILTWLIARQDLIAFSRHESFKSYFTACTLQLIISSMIKDFS
jgi:glutaminase